MKMDIYIKIKNVRKTISVLIIITVVILNLLPIITSEKISQPDEMIFSNYYDKGFRYNIQGWVYLHIEGDPYERGFQYGYLASNEIVDTLQRWSNLAHNFKFMKKYIIKNLPQNYEKLSEKWWEICRTKSEDIFLKYVPEEYKNEIEGIVDGLKEKKAEIFGRSVQFEDILASQFVQDVWHSCFKYKNKQFHPFRGLFYGLKEIISGDLSNHEPGHCSAFIATGDATNNGGIVVAHTTLFNPYIAQRCNIILDVKPTEGYRFMMTCPPGSLWSQEDYYQNEQGIILTETELPQGPWKRDGIPKGIRSRTAIQYSKNIDEVVSHLMNGNNGLIPNEWLIGDTKTGEIAAIEQSLFNTPIKRTFNGVYWSTNVPHDKKVKRELFGVIDLFRITSKIFFDSYDNGRDEKFEEIITQFYGKIDLEVAKEIVATEPICTGMTDGKITNSDMMEDMGLLAFFGPLTGDIWVPTNNDESKFRGITKLLPLGWVEIYPSSSRSIEVKKFKTFDNKNENYKLVAEFEKDSAEMKKYLSSLNEESTDSPYQIYDNIKYFGSWDGNLYALDAKTEDIKWTFQTGWGIVSKPFLTENNVYFGSLDNNFYALNITDGKLKWVFRCNSAIHSSPVVYGEYVFFGCDDGRFYALNKDAGEYVWSFTPGYYITNDNINNYITTPILSDPIVRDNIVYLSVNERVYALDAQTTEKQVGNKIDIIKTRDYNILFVLLAVILILLIIILVIKKKEN